MRSKQTTASRIVKLAVPLAALVILAGPTASALAQEDPTVLRRTPVETKQFGDLAEGPYERLVIRNVNVIPGHGGPPVGPYDILIEGNVISEMRRFDPIQAKRARERGEPIERLEGDRIIEGDGRYVMPGMINLHLHLRQEPLPLEYIYYLQLATGVTTLGPASDRGVEEAMAEAERSARNEILAPRMFPLWSWGSNVEFSDEELEDPGMAPEIAEEMVRQGARQVYLNSLCWNQELFGAAAKAVEEAGGITAVHIQPSSTSVINAVDAARLGVTMIVHHYGYAESALNRQVQDYPRDYDYFDENERFREAARVWLEVGENPETRHRLLNDVVQELVDSGVVMQPNRATYEANRDVLAAQGRPWHEKYTHQALWELHLPSVENHAVFHYDWTSDDEYYWNYMYDLWADLIFEFNKRGGMVAYGTDDNYQWSTGGFGNIRELQLVRESGMHNLEVLRTANQNSARVLKEPKLGLVREGYLADLLLVDGNPAADFRTLYPFGAVRLGEDGEMYRTEGIVHTIKDGIVIDNDRLMEEVARMVAESKENAGPDVINRPFLPYPDWMSRTPEGGSSDAGSGDGGR